MEPFFVSETQPWRSTQPAPELHTTPVPEWLRAWWPALLWAGFIFVMSTDIFSAHHTSAILEPLIRWFAPSLSDDDVEFVHFVIRKCAHFTEYFVFGALLYRAVRGAHKGWRWTWALCAWFIAVCYSALDEIHQAFVSSRTASPYDSLIDSSGALVAMIVLLLWFHRSGARKNRSAIP
jgi:VanZ family protein